MLRALLVDDETPARDRLRALLADHEDIEVVGEADDAEIALARIAELSPDLVFLDIQMPGRSGLEVAASLAPPRPRIIFCTAYDHYAVEAFERHAVGYLLKPLNRAKLARTLEEVRRNRLETERALRELVAATATQARLLPRSFPTLATLRVAGACRPAREIGGDYYDFIAISDDRVMLALADVSGKGLDAGLLGAALQARVQALAPQLGDRLELLAADVDRWLGESTSDNRFATAFLATYSEATRQLSYVNAGHVPALLLRAGTDQESMAIVETLNGNGPVLGLLPDAHFKTSQVRLDRGDLLLIFSDGVVEAEDPAGVELGADRLGTLAGRYASLDPAELAQRLLDEVERRAKGALRADDMTIVVARAE